IGQRVQTRRWPPKRTSFPGQSWQRAHGPARAQGREGAGEPAMKRRHLRASKLTVLGLGAALAGLGGCSQSSTSGTGSGSAADSVAGVQSILFIKRQTTTVVNGKANVDVAGGKGAGV